MEGGSGMKRKVISLAVIACIAIGMVAFFDAPASYAKMAVEDANNRECPVTGKAIKAKRFNTVYDGKRYWFHSYDAVRKFKASPGRYAGNLRSYSSPPAKKKKESRSFW